MSCNVGTGGKTVVLGGLGAVGSHLLPLMARAPEVARLIMADPDRYEAGNLRGQNIRADDVGQLKVDAMARAVHAIRPELEVVTHAARLEEVPMALLRGDVLVSCLDSRRARQSLNRVAWRLQKPWLDAAVGGEQMLARVAVYGVGADEPCLECRWDAHTYHALLEPVYTCSGDATAGAVAHGVAATNSPAELTALAAAHLAAAVRRVLAGDAALNGREVLIDARHQTIFVARFAHNPACRFDHRGVLVTATLPADTPLGVLRDAHGVSRLAVEGHRFVLATTCSACGARESVAPMLSRGLTLEPCPRCGAARVADLLAERDVLATGDCDPCTSLAELGLRAGDLLTLTRSAGTRSPGRGGETFHLELEGNS